MQSNPSELTSIVKQFAYTNGAHLVGVASVDRFDCAPQGHHPTDMLSDCNSVIVIAIRILDRGLLHGDLLPNGSDFLPELHVRRVMQDYFWEIESHGPASDILSNLALRTAMLLQDLGHGSICFRSSNGDAYGSVLAGRIQNYTSLFSHRHAAVRAGLGEFGLNNMVITPQYGPRVRLVSVLTSALLEPDPLLDSKVCLGERCQLCLMHCGHLGVITLEERFDAEIIWMNTVSKTCPELCVQTSTKNYCKGKCIGSCPVGARV